MSSFVTVQMAGWLETISNGISTLYLSLVEEGITTGPGDTPANVQYKPAITNAQSFSIRRAPASWWEGNDSNALAASFGTLQINNQQSDWDMLLEFDFQDTGIVIQLPVAKSLTFGTETRDSLVICTGIIDKISEDENRIISINIRDTLTRLDRNLPMRFVPGFRDSGAANVMVPFRRGVTRNAEGLLVDAENRLYLLNDEVVPNILKVADMAAPLDPHATPPQYSPALNGCGVQLDTAFVGKGTFDTVSNGSQSPIPGVDDVLNGDGQFLGTWTGSPPVPPNWSWTHGTGSSITELTNPPIGYLGSSNGVRLLSRKVYNPNGGSFGEEFVHSYDLQPGSTYRVSFIVANIQQSAPYFNGGMVGGLILTTAKSLNSADYITGMNTPLTSSGLTPQHLSFEFTIPKGSSTRKLYFLVVPSAGNADNTANGFTSLELGDVAIELVGQFVDQPATPLPFADYVYDVLVTHAGEDESIFNQTEAESVFVRSDGSLKPWGIMYKEPPNILDCLRVPSRCDGFTFFTDSTGQIRFRKQVDPRDPVNQTNIKCDFTEFNMSQPVFSDDVADNLTTLFGSRANQDPFSDADFVTDEAIVSSDTKTRYKRASQFWSYASYVPFQQYAFAINAPIFDTVFDEKPDADEEVNRVVGMFSPKRYANGTVNGQKRRRISFTATYDDPTAMGVNTKCAINELMGADIIKIDYVDRDNDGNVIRELHCYGSVVTWEPLPLANQFKIVARI